MSGSTTVDVLAGIGAESNVRSALDDRADILEATRAAEDATLSPREPGGLSHDLRAALATRIARLHHLDDLAVHFRAKVSDPTAVEAADPAFEGGDDARLSAILRFTDLVSARTKDADHTDIVALKSAGISDADIVRLAELNGFIAYQVRVIDGLRLMTVTR